MLSRVCAGEKKAPQTGGTRCSQRRALAGVVYLASVSDLRCHRWMRS